MRTFQSIESIINNNKALLKKLSKANELAEKTTEQENSINQELERLSKKPVIKPENRMQAIKQWAELASTGLNSPVGRGSIANSQFEYYSNFNQSAPVKHN